MSHLLSTSIKQIAKKDVDSPASQLQNKISVHIKLQKPCQSSLLPLFYVTARVATREHSCLQHQLFWKIVPIN